jgi:microsomal dipeptidase-like Zn-dependent dipeptidase
LRFDDAVERSRGALRAIRSRADLDALVSTRAAGDPVIGVLLASEGMHPLEGDLGKLEPLFDAGFRMLAPTHFFDNAVAGSAHGVEKGGLTPLGERAVDRMRELGMILDLAHASPDTVDDVLDRARGPVIVSHTGVQGTCPGPRNLSDAQLRRIAQGGGVIGIGFFAGAVCDVSPQGIARAMRHAATVAGVRHVALGSDWNGGTRVQVDPTRLVALTEALLRAEFSEDEVRAIMGENALRVLRSLLPQ